MPSTNWVQFKHSHSSLDGFEAGIYSGEFTVEDYCVTEGAAHNITVGYTTTFGKDDDGWFRFEIDRSGSVDTAIWWNDRVKARESTFGHAAESLNFAVKGTLKLTFIKHDTSTTILDKIFPNVFLAQGHSFSSNNWWIAATGALQSAVGQEGLISVKDTNNVPTIFERGGGTDGKDGDQMFVDKIHVRF